MELKSVLKAGTALPVRTERPLHEPTTSHRLCVERQPHGPGEPGFIQHTVERYDNTDLPVGEPPTPVFVVDISYQVRGGYRYPFRYSIFATNSPSTSDMQTQAVNL